MTADGYLLFAYGDYGVNTGPISVIGYRPSDGSIVTFLSNLRDERIEDYRVLNDGVIWTCPTDPMGREEATLAHSAPGGVGPWTRVTAAVPGKGVAVHLFDVAQATNGDLFVCLARNYTEAEMTSQALLPNWNPDAEYNTGLAVWKSTNGGTTWTEDFVDLKNNDGYYRPYGMIMVNDHLVVPTSDGTHFVRSPSGSWSAKQTSPAIYNYRPIIPATNGHFATTGNGGVLFEIVNGKVQSLAFPTMANVIGTGPNGWIWLDNYGRMRYGTTLYGVLPQAPYGWRAVVDPSGDIYLSNSYNLIFRASPPVA